ncbi:MAG TPA: methyltransferase domain-containing protein [Candidatus Acidoferrum sp.]|nr:methyltransferase domain-containing protein [Candidatus Acidoferrum sp.]
MSLTKEMSLATSAPDITWTHRALPLILDAIPVGCRSLLDVGCGRGIIGALCRIYRLPERLVGIDGFAPYVEFTRSAGMYDETLLRNLNDMPLPFRSQEFEVVTCTEVIEHLEWSAGQKLLDELERIGSHIIVTTPNIDFQQSEYDGNVFQRHLSKWKPRNFQERGYRVYGVGILNVGYGMKAVAESVVGCAASDTMFAHVRKSARYISEALGALTRRLPQLSSNLLCVKAQSIRQNVDLTAGS